MFNIGSIMINKHHLLSNFYKVQPNKWIKLFIASDILEVDIAFLLATFVLLMLSLFSAGIFDTLN